MSKALCSAASLAASATTSAPAGAQASPVSGPLIGLLAAGVCVLGGWVFLRVLRPDKLLLRRVPGRQNQLSVLHVAAVFLAYVASMPLAVRAMAKACGVEADSTGQLPMTVQLPGSIFGQLVLIGGGLTVAAMTFSHGLRRGLGLNLRRVHHDAARAIIGCLAVLPLCHAALEVTRFLMPAKWIVIHPLLMFLLAPETSAAWVAAVWLSALVLAPIGEELLYRGLVQSMLRRYGLGPWPAIAIASIVFAVSHASQPQDMPALLLLSLALGYNYERTGRLIAPMLLHGLFNAATIWTVMAG